MVAVTVVWVLERMVPPSQPSRRGVILLREGRRSGGWKPRIFLCQQSLLRKEEQRWIINMRYRRWGRGMGKNTRT
jgi:hypothetical protein